MVGSKKKRKRVDLVDFVDRIFPVVAPYDAVRGRRIRPIDLQDFLAEPRLQCLEFRVEDVEGQNPFFMKMKCGGGEGANLLLEQSAYAA